MDEGELRSALQNTGLTQYQAAAYLALLDLGAAPAADIAEASGVPGPRIYDVLRDLEQRGYVELYKQGQLHARVHDPSSVIETFEASVKQFEQAKASIEERWQQPDLENYAVSIVKRRETAYERATTAIENAHNQIKLSVNENQFDRLRPAIQTAYSNGAHVKVCLWTPPGDGLTIERGRFAGGCTEVRHRDLPAPYLAIVDRDTVCFAPNEQSTNEYGVLVNDPSHAYVFNVFFQTSLWAQWKTVFEEDAEERANQYVDIRECVRDVTPLLEEGATIRARVIGTEVGTGEPVDIDGTIVDTGHDSGATRDEAAYPSLNGVASLTVETDDGTYTAGGWGAMLEDIEATRVIIAAVDRE